MQLPAVLGITGLKLAGHADSDKATGRPEAGANFPKKEGRKRQEGRCQLNINSHQAPSSKWRTQDNSTECFVCSEPTPTFFW